MKNRLSILNIVFIATFAGQLSAQSYPFHRVYDTKAKRFVDFETMVARLATQDLVFLGEQHNDPRTHQLQAAVLEGIARRRSGPIVLALEMFERDVQGPLDNYLTGTLSEEQFLATSRPWPNYPTDYRPMVEFARSKQWPVIAGNIPRRYASQVARRGLAAIDSLPAAERGGASWPRGDRFPAGGRAWVGGGAARLPARRVLGAFSRGDGRHGWPRHADDEGAARGDGLAHL